MLQPHFKHRVQADLRESSQITRDVLRMKNLGTATALLAVAVPVLFGTVLPTTALAIGAAATGVAALALNRKIADDKVLKSRAKIQEQQGVQGQAAMAHEHV